MILLLYCNTSVRGDAKRRTLQTRLYAIEMSSETSEKVVEESVSDVTGTVQEDEVISVETRFTRNKTVQQTIMIDEPFPFCMYSKN